MKRKKQLLTLTALSLATFLSLPSYTVAQLTGQTGSAYRCYHMGYDYGSDSWGFRPAKDAATCGHEPNRDWCRQNDGCFDGNDEGDACYKWALGPDQPHYPWDSDGAIDGIPYGGTLVCGEG